MWGPEGLGISTVVPLYFVLCTLLLECRASFMLDSIRNGRNYHRIYVISFILALDQLIPEYHFQPIFDGTSSPALYEYT